MIKKHLGLMQHEQTLWNMRIALIVMFILFFQGFLFSIGIIRLAIREENYMWLAGGFLLFSFSCFGMVEVFILFKFTKIKIYENGIVVPSSLRDDLRYYRKYKVRGIFYPFDEIVDIYGEGKRFLLIKTKEKKTGGYFFTTKQRDDLLLITLNAQKKYNEKKKGLLLASDQILIAIRFV
jgi:hypothetical protein